MGFNTKSWYVMVIDFPWIWGDPPDFGPQNLVIKEHIIQTPARAQCP